MAFVMPSFIKDEESKRQAKLRSRACNDSFRLAVDKSYYHSQDFDSSGKILSQDLSSVILR